MTSPEFTGALTSIMASEQFQPNAKVLEITGRCSHCRETH
jgi:hypothetical protein